MVFAAFWNAAERTGDTGYMGEEGENAGKIMGCVDGAI
jgi:hypothetical protein